VPGRLWGVPDDDEHDLNYDNHGGATCGNNVIEPGEQCERNEGTCRDVRFSYVRVRVLLGSLTHAAASIPRNVYATPACPCGANSARSSSGGDGYCYPRTCAPSGTLTAVSRLVLECARLVCEVLRGFDVFGLLPFRRVELRSGRGGGSAACLQPGHIDL